MMNIPDKRRAISAISKIKNKLFKDTHIHYEDPYSLPDFNAHITKPENRNKFAKRRDEIGDMFEWTIR
jgi:hypothetical protein